MSTPEPKPDCKHERKYQSSEELLELEAEWMAQNTWLDYRNWLQSELLKSRQDSKAAYSQGYKDALNASAGLAATLKWAIIYKANQAVLSC